MHRLLTGDDGMAKNTLWVTDRRGNKLSNFHAEMLAERIGDFVVYCTPDSKVPLTSQRTSRCSRCLRFLGNREGSSMR